MVQWVSAGFRRENVRTLDWQIEDKSVKQFRKKGFTMDIILKLSEELGIRKSQAEAAVKLIDEGNTIPFIARYRKEVTGSLNDEVLRNLYERLTYLRNLEERKETVLNSIEEQGKLTDELKAQILAAETMVAVEDLYRPYKPKRRTRATIAKERGLEPLANVITLQMLNTPLEAEAAKFINPEKEVNSAEDAIAGAKDIIAEAVSDEADYRTRIRDLTMKKGHVTSTAKDPEAESVYEMYYEFDEPVNKLAGHRILALNRGENEKILNVKVEAPEEDILRFLERKVITRDNPNTTPVLKEVVADAYDRLIAPAIEREIRSSLTEMAEDGAIRVFGKNLEQLLMQPPIAGQVVLGWDPAFRTGCKLAVVDPTGKVLDTTVIYPTAPQNKVEEAKTVLKKLISKYDLIYVILILVAIYLIINFNFSLEHSNIFFSYYQIIDLQEKFISLYGSGILGIVKLIILTLIHIIIDPVLINFLTSGNLYFILFSLGNILGSLLSVIFAIKYLLLSIKLFKLSNEKYIFLIKFTAYFTILTSFIVMSKDGYIINRIALMWIPLFIIILLIPFNYSYKKRTSN